MKGIDADTAFARGLARIGCQLALDDLGTRVWRVQQSAERRWGSRAAAISRRRVERSP
jgi:hypothetical protein